MTPPYKFSYFETRSSDPELITLEQFVDKIKAPKPATKRLITMIKNGKTNLKTHLPSVTLSGDFSTIKKEGLNSLNGLLCIDFDHIENPKIFRDKIASDTYTLAAFLSVSGTGVAAIVKIDSERFSDSFDNLEQYYLKEYNAEIDPACKNNNRLRFLSHDADIKVNMKSAQFEDYSLAKKEEHQQTLSSAMPNEERPGDTYNEKADIPSLLMQHGWSLFKTVAKEQQWCRPGKKTGNSATWNGQHLYVFTSNAPGFTGMQGYTPFAVYSILEHGGDYNSATKALGEEYTSDIECPILNLRNLNTVKEQQSINAHESMSMTFDKFMNEEFPKEEILIDGFLERTDLMLIIAPSKSRKTFFTLQLALSISHHLNVLGLQPTKSHKVMYVNLELKKGKLQKRMKKMVKNLTIEEVNPNLVILSLRQYIEEEILAVVAREALIHQPALIIIDPLYKVHDGDENKMQDMNRVFKGLGGICRTSNAALAIVHHDAKGFAGDRDQRDRGSGSSLIGRDCDCSLTLTEHAEEEDHYCVDVMTRDYKPREPIVIKFDQGHFIMSEKEYNPKTSTSKKKPNLQDIADKTIEHIKVAGALPILDIEMYIEDIGATTKANRKTVIRMIEAGGGIYRSDKINRTHYIGTTDAIVKMNDEAKKNKLGVN
jgi:hypothetical protein